MSKKIAEGTASLVLDVKFGSGAFLQDPARGRELAETMVRLGNDAGVATRALLTNMNVPLGLAIGNANEVRESVEVLAGGGPSDVVALTVALAREMLELAGIHDADVSAALNNGQAMDSWRAMISAQGGDPDAALPAPPETHVVRAERSGVLVEQQALPFGIAAWRLGAGRARQQDPVVHAAGIDLHAKPGDTVAEGQPLFTLGTDDPDRFARALEALEGAYRIGDAGEPVDDGGPLIAGRIG
jgi:thymidine phosphorylase